MRDWNVCIEIGLNHLGSLSKLKNILNKIPKKNKHISISIQIREDEFYYGKNKYLWLKPDYYSVLTDFCFKNDIPFGFAIGPVKDLSWIKKFKPTFLKILYMATLNSDFIINLKNNFNCELFFSTGAINFKKNKNNLLPYIPNNANLVYTVLSHQVSDQNLLNMQKLSKLKYNVGFGNHSSESTICYAAIGAGAKKIFIYVGDKSLNLPDKNHALDLSEINNFIKNCEQCFLSMKNTKILKNKIEFIG